MARGIWVAGLAVVLAAGAARGQVAPGGGGFFGGAPGGVVAFDPEPSAVFSGVGMWVGATVTGDMKHVRLNMMPQVTQVTSVQNFPVFFNGGFVGTANQAGEVSLKAPLDPGIKGGSASPPIIVSTSSPPTGILAAPGMTKLASLD